MALSPQQLDILTRTVLGEAANQGIPGMAGVASVIRNRANSGQFPSDPSAVALQPWQFSAWNASNKGGNNVGRNADPSSRSYQDAQSVVQAVFNGQMDDPTKGALYYHTGAVHPSWDKSMTPTAQIGAHTFYTPTGQNSGPGMSSQPKGLAAIQSPPPNFNPQAADKMISGEFASLPQQTSQPDMQTMLAQQATPTPSFGQSLSTGVGGALKSVGAAGGLASLPAASVVPRGNMIPLSQLVGMFRPYGNATNGLGQLPIG